MTDVPWLALTVGAFALAVVFAAGVGVPRDRPPARRGAVLRWGHAVVWVLLALMFGAIASAADAMVAPLGLAALATYLLFLAVLLGSRQRPGSGPTS
jgi:hypothetical protein